MLAILVSLAACTPGVVDGMMTASGTTLQSDKAHIKTPEIAGEDLAALAESNGALAFDIYRQLKAEDGNLFYSPYSISAALAMAYAGAAGMTAQQMAEIMHFDLPPEQLHPAFNWLQQTLASRGKGGDEDFRLHVANAIWGQKDHKFKAAFLNTLAENYGAGLRIVNFGNRDESRVTINNWINEQTEGRIQELVAPGDITTDTRLVLTNAIYFKAAWEHKFLQSATKDQPFYLLDGESVTIPMMHQTFLFGYAEGEGYQAVELPYEGDELAMMILLPEKGTFTAFENSLDYQKLAAIITSLQERNTVLNLPKFQFESSFSLKEALSALGIADAFDANNADFSGMTDLEHLWIDNIKHKAFVSVDENGTEASAATSAVMVSSLPATVTIDRPFIFLIRDFDTGTILFIGRVLNPAS